ncbi:MAG TPA: DUF937 domain-containing protein [Amaricoccus sp.]|nr:DUF937 domain-containing protein [Amaricoccus sp.]
MDVLKLVSQYATPTVIEKVASLLGISGDSVQKGLGAAVPGVLAALLGLGQKPGGTDALASALVRAGDGGAVGQDPAAAASTGTDLLSSLLGGDATGKLAGALGSYAGLPNAGAGSLLGLAGSMALGALNKSAGDGGAAGALRLLESSKNEIAAALPSGFAQELGGTGLLAGLGSAAAAAAPVRPAPVPPKPAPAAPRPAPPPPPKKSGWTRWLIWLVVAALLFWLLSQWLAPESEPVVETPAPEATAPATVTTEPAAPATTVEPAAPATAPEPTAAPAAPAETAAVPDNPLLVGGVDLGAQVSGALDQITGAFAGITDAASAQAALPDLTAARDTLAGLEPQVTALPEAGKSALKSLIAAELPAIETSANSLLANTAVAGTVKPVVDDIIARLKAYSA